MPKFSDLYLNNLKPTKDRYEVYDTLLPAFGCRIGARTKTFIVIDSSGIRRKLGHYPAMRLAEAREKARALMTGRPSSNSSFADVVDAYVERHLLPNCRPSHAKEIERLLRKHFPFTKPIAHIARHEILAVIDNLETHSLANHCTVAIKMLFNWADERGYLDHNPIARLKKPFKESKRDRVLSYDELAKIWFASKPLHGFGVVIRLCILTGQRRGELSQIVDAWHADNAITFPASITKNARPHSIPLTTSVLNELSTLQRPAAWSKPKIALDKACGVTDWVIHDLRRSFSTHLNELGIAPHIVERLLNHALPGVAGTYNRAQHFEEMRQALNRWEAELVAKGVLK